MENTTELDDLAWITSVLQECIDAVYTNKPVTRSAIIACAQARVRAIEAALNGQDDEVE